MARLMEDKDPMPFGKHKGERMDKVPASYLIWFDEQTWAWERPVLREYVKRNMTVLQQELREQRRGR